MKAPVWFRPKLYGFGATPITWQGWALIAAFVAAVLVAAWIFLGFDRSVRPSPGNVVAFFATVAVLLAGLWIVSQWTTAGEWHWRWGRE